MEQRLQSLLHDEQVIGGIRSVRVDFGMNMPFGVDNPSARTNSRDLGAGVLLDIGIYPLTWASLALDKANKRNTSTEAVIIAGMVFYKNEADPGKRIDESNAIILSYPELCAQAVCTTSWICDSDPEFAHIRGEKGSIQLVGSVHRFLGI